jgi:AcrR family transcriptional regulator
VARKNTSDSPPLSPVAESLRQQLVEKATERAAAEVTKRVDKAVSKAVSKAFTTTATKLEAKGLLAESLDFWTRNSAGSRKPRINRYDIAEVAMRVADTEGFDAVSMRRLATELDVGTMSLYHYLRTKDELLTLLVDTFLGEVIVPPDQKLPRPWKRAIAVIALRSRDSLRRHPWVLDIADSPRIGPNALLHFDQSWQALASLDATFEDKVDLLTAVDEYVYGFCLQERANSQPDKGTGNAMADYIEGLLAIGHYPSLTSLTAKVSMRTLWTQVMHHSQAPDRFERNLGRLLAGFEATI